MNRAQAIEILHAHVRNQNLIKHMMAAEAIMRALARHFGEDEDMWGLAGLLHDVDWEETASTPHLHTVKSKDYLTAAGLEDEIVQAIYVHNHMHGLEPQTLLEKGLYCAEELTGLIVACALVQPDKQLASVTSQSILKKFKTLSFAAGVNRDIIKLAETSLGLPLQELIELELKAMQAIADELGL